MKQLVLLQLYAASIYVQYSLVKHFGLKKISRHLSERQYNAKPDM